MREGGYRSAGRVVINGEQPPNTGSQGEVARGRATDAPGTSRKAWLAWLGPETGHRARSGRGPVLAILPMLAPAGPALRVGPGGCALPSTCAARVGVREGSGRRASRRFDAACGARRTKGWGGRLLQPQSRVRGLGQGGDGRGAPSRQRDASTRAGDHGSGELDATGRPPAQAQGALVPPTGHHHRASAPRHRARRSRQLGRCG